MVIVLFNTMHYSSNLAPSAVTLSEQSMTDTSCFNQLGSLLKRNKLKFTLGDKAYSIWLTVMAESLTNNGL
jgi:hypothetical protein